MLGKGLPVLRVPRSVWLPCLCCGACCTDDPKPTWLCDAEGDSTEAIELTRGREPDEEGDRLLAKRTPVCASAYGSRECNSDVSISCESMPLLSSARMRHEPRSLHSYPLADVASPRAARWCAHRRRWKACSSAAAGRSKRMELPASRSRRCTSARWFSKRWRYTERTESATMSASVSPLLVGRTFRQSDSVASRKAQEGCGLSRRCHFRRRWFTLSAEHVSDRMAIDALGVAHCDSRCSCCGIAVQVAEAPLVLSA